MGTGFSFTPTDSEASQKLPFFEDARADYAPYYGSGSRYSVSRAKSMIAAEIGKLGGAITSFNEGFFGSEDSPRYGYVIEFMLNGKPGRIKVAGLPMRHFAAGKLEKVRVQALMNVRDWLKSAVTSMIFSPGNNPLIPHLLGPKGMTLAEYIASDVFPDTPLLLGEIVEDED